MTCGRSLTIALIILILIILFVGYDNKIKPKPPLSVSDVALDAIASSVALDAIASSAVTTTSDNVKLWADLSDGEKMDYGYRLETLSRAGRAGQLPA